MIVNQYQDDIFADWKKQRFIVAEYAVAKDTIAHTVILTNIAFWSDHVEQLDTWCEHNPGAKRIGMVVEFDTAELLTLFVLRWL
jgi:hypothetical protein